MIHYNLLVVVVDCVYYIHNFSNDNNSVSNLQVHNRLIEYSLSIHFLFLNLHQNYSHTYSYNYLYHYCLFFNNIQFHLFDYFDCFDCFDCFDGYIF